MDRSTFKQFKKLLQSLPPWGNPSSREAFLKELFFGHSLLQQFDIGAPGDVASSQLVELLNAHQKPNVAVHLPVLALRREDLTKALQQTRPSLVHFSGHGGGSPGLYLEDAQGEAQLVSTEALARVFRLLEDDVQAVVLNACLSEPQAKAIGRHIGYVVGTADSIGDEAATRFSVGFYRALAAGQSVEQAFQAGCTEIQVADIPEQDVPLLMTGPGSVIRCGD